MAQTDTGMGWSAKTEWLREQSGIMGTFSESTNPDFVNQPIPVVTDTTFEGIVTGGMLAGYNPSYPTYNFYVGANADNVFICQASDYGLTACSPTQGAAVYLALSGTNYGNYRDSIHCSQYDQASGMYYGSTALPNYYTQYKYRYIPYYGRDTTSYSGLVYPPKTLNAVLADFSIVNKSFYKLNNGYSVTCFAKYNNTGGGVTFTPLLISTDSNAVAISTDGQNPTSYVMYSFLKDGVHFYMAMIPTEEHGNVNSPAVEIGALTNFAVLVPQGVFNAISSEDWANILVKNSPDPYGDNPSEPGGGDSGTVADDRVGIIHNPFIPSALGTGLVRAFCPTQSDLNTLRNWLWETPGQGGLDLDDLKRVFVDPADNILGLSVVPLSLTGPSVNFSFGGVVPSFTLPQLQHQYYQVQCGYIDIEKRWGSYLDYEPYTEFYIYLPFIGMKPISADEIMGKQLIVDYDIDVVSGACLARVQAGQNLLYSWSGQCAMQIPVNARNWDSIFATAIQCATQVATGIATGGSSLLGGAAAASVNALTTKARVQHSGVLTSTAGWMGNLTPYIVRVNPVLAIPEDQNKFIGYPSWTSVNLGSLTGFNIISSIHLEGVPATDNELTEIEEILKEGVIF